MVKAENRVHAVTQTHLILALVHFPFCQGQPESRHCSDPVGEPKHFLLQVFSWYHSAYHADFMGSLRGEWVPGVKNLLGKSWPENPGMSEILHTGNARL